MTAADKKKKERCGCGCGDWLINPFSEDDYQTLAEPYPEDYE